MPRKNLKLPEPLFNALRDDKDDTESWPHYFERKCLTEAGDGTLPDGVREQLDRIEAAAATTEERTGALDRKVDDMRGGR